MCASRSSQQIIRGGARVGACLDHPEKSKKYSLSEAFYPYGGLFLHVEGIFFFLGAMHFLRVGGLSSPYNYVDKFLGLSTVPLQNFGGNPCFATRVL